MGFYASFVLSDGVRTSRNLRTASCLPETEGKTFQSSVA